MAIRSAFWLSLLLFLCCATNKLPKEEIEGMKSHYLLEYGKKPDLWPLIVGLKEDVYSIFPVPVENAVGTNVINSAITLIRFKGDKIQYDHLIKDHFGASAGGLFSHPPVFDSEWIAYGQSRGFMIFNTKTHVFLDHIPYPKMELRITDVRVIPTQPFTFIIQVE